MLSGFLPLLKEYNVKRANHIFITVGHKRETSMKIFRRDGMEIKYSEGVEEAGTTGAVVLAKNAEDVQIIGISISIPMSFSKDSNIIRVIMLKKYKMF